MKSILFVCNANRFRSILAAAILRSLLQKDRGISDWEISSAGTWTQNGLPPIPEAIAVAEKYGLNIGSDRSREVSKELLESASIIITMTESQRESLVLEFPQINEKIRLLSEVFESETYDIPDFAEDLDSSTESIGDEIYTMITQGYSKFRELV